MLQTHRVLRSPEIAAAPAGGQSGVGTAGATPLSPRLALAQLLSEESSPAPDVPQDAPPSPAAGDPATPAAPDATEDTGQDISSETPPADGTESPAAGEPETVLPESQNAELTQALAGLSPTERQSALELVKEFKPGEIPRIAKLVAERHQAHSTIEAQQKQIEELQTAREDTRPTNGATALPESVTKLKTLQQVNARLETVRSTMNDLQDFLDNNPGDKRTVYDVQSGEVADVAADGQRYVTRESIVTRKAQLRGEAEALPQQGQRLAQQAQFQQAKAEARAKVVADFPYLNDPEHADTKAAQQLLKSDPILQSYAHGDYLALALARGHRELQAEAAARKGNGHGKLPFGNAGQRPAPLAGKVPLGKPHAPVGTAPVARGEGPKVKEALAAHEKNGSRSSLAEVISAAGL